MTDKSEKELWEQEFKAAMRRPLATRIRYSFIKTYKPVLDDASYRSFESTADYRRWCETQLLSWLGYGSISISTGREVAVCGGSKSQKLQILGWSDSFEKEFIPSTCRKEKYHLIGFAPYQNNL